MFNALSVKRRTFNPELPTSNEVGGWLPWGEHCQTRYAWDRR